MGSIMSGVGLVSGLNYQDIVDQLMAIEARPRDQLLGRIGNIDAQRTAYLGISARITALLARVEVLSQSTAFRAAKATSSNADVLSANATRGAKPGSYTFMVRALATTHQLVSRGYQDRLAPVREGTLSIESAQARVNGDTGLDELNGHAGVRRGSFKIIDRTGKEATINIADAVTLNEVVERINAAGTAVRAAVREDRLSLTDTSQGGGKLQVLEVGGGSAAADLGFGIGNNSTTEPELAGTSLLYLSTDSPLSALNDRLGIRTSRAGGDFTVEIQAMPKGPAGPSGPDGTFSVNLSDLITQDTRLQRLNHGQGVRLGKIRITSRDKKQVEVDLSTANTIADVERILESAFADRRISVVLSGSRMIVSDSTSVDKLTSEQKSDLIIEDLEGSAAHDLGIDGRSSQGKIEGRNVVHMDTVADVLAAINYAPGNEGSDRRPLLTAALAEGGRGFVLRTKAGPFKLKIPDAQQNPTSALRDLGFEPGTYNDQGGGAVAVGGRVLGGLNSVLLKTLNGGGGIRTGTIHISVDGKEADVDLSGAVTLHEIVDRINKAAGKGGLTIEAGYDRTGTRLLIHNTAGQGKITITDVGAGTFAKDLGLTVPAEAVRSINLQRQYVNENTRLDDLNAGRGIARGKIKITDSKGASKVLDLSAASIATLGSVIGEINNAGLGVKASINASGDGLLIVDTAGGNQTLKIEEQGGTTARDLNLTTAAKDGRIDGSFEFKLQVGGNDTIESLAARIGQETTLARGTLLHDGNRTAPYRLSIAALGSGAGGELIVDDGTTGLGISTLTRAQDARLLFGSDPAGGVLITSASNTFGDVISGVRLTANSVDDKPVTVTIEQDIASITTALAGLAEDFNGAIDAIRKAGKYDADKEVLGILQGESALRIVEDRLFRSFSRQFTGGGVYQRLADVGLKYSGSGHLSFDKEKFETAFGADPEGVERFFSLAETGAATIIEEEIKKLTDDGGVIDRRTDALQDRKSLFEERVEQLNEQLERKRARLLRQFQAMEQSLSLLQAQQQALTNFQAHLSSSTQTLPSR